MIHDDTMMNRRVSHNCIRIHAKDRRGSAQLPEFVNHAKVSQEDAERAIRVERSAASLDSDTARVRQPDFPGSAAGLSEKKIIGRNNGRLSLPYSSCIWPL